MTIIDLPKKSKAPCKKIFTVPIQECFPLNTPTAEKEVLHLTLDLTGTELENYPIGSSFGLLPENDPAVALALTKIFNPSAKDQIFCRKTLSWFFLHDFLQKKADLSKVTTQQLHYILETTQHPMLKNLLSSAQEKRVFLQNNDVLSLLSTFWDPRLSPQAFCNLLCPLLPRFYSIASSSKVVGAQVHFMVASFSYPQAGQTHSNVMAHHLKILMQRPNPTIQVFLQHNPHFTLPQDPKAPIIMIGPGTGLAAFRGFIQERISSGSTGTNWLFTGDRHKEHNFYYAKELQSYAKKNLLRLDTAFSRDTPEKTYVQHKMLQSAPALWEQIDHHGATIYLSGDAKRMAKDVQKTLLSIFEAQGHLSPEAARLYLKRLRQTRRLLLDVY